VTAKKFYDWQTVGGTDDVRRLMFLLFLILAGCTKTAEEPATPAGRAAEAAAATPLPWVADPPPESAPAIVATPPQLPVQSEAPSLPDNAADLNVRFHARSATPEERDEIIKTLGRLDPPQALPALRRIFEEEKRLELRMRVLEVAGDLPADAAPGRWELFARATEARQPVVIRLGAMQTLTDFDDPRVVPLLQQLTRDSNASIRENATRILQERQP
jgi:hypothetical protein